MRRFPAVACACLVAALSWSPGQASADRRNRDAAVIPDLVLWAWERPEDLRGLDDRVGVAFLAQTIAIDRGAVDRTPRRQPLRVSPATKLVAVTRIETFSPAALTGNDLDSIASSIVRTSALPQVVAVQVDFDAVQSERGMYRDLLRRVRKKLDRNVPLSITALASWCAGDRWLNDLPIDEAVAMLFRLGPVNAPYAGIAATPSAAARECSAVGVSLDEPMPVSRSGRRLYVFDARPWTRAAVANALGVAE